jgi:hypothetical protein
LTSSQNFARKERQQHFGANPQKDEQIFLVSMANPVADALPILK